MGMILCIASSHIVGEGDIVGRSGCFKFKLSANSVMRGRVNAIRTFKGLVADLRLTYYFMNRRYRNLLICLFSILLLGTYHSTLYWLDRPRTSLVFYNVRGCPAVHCIESDGRSWINYVDTISNEKRLKRMAANYWKHHHLLPPKEITADCRYMELNRQQQIISYHGCHICVINDNHWRNKTTVSPLYIQYLYLCKGYDGHLEELTRIFSFSYVILDASLSEYRRHLLESECKQSGLRFISLSDEGSVRFLL